MVCVGDSEHMADVGAAWQNGFHPVRDYLDGLAWDGTRRIDSWLFEYCGAARRGDDYDRYITAVASCWWPRCAGSASPDASSTSCRS